MDNPFEALMRYLRRDLWPFIVRELVLEKGYRRLFAAGLILLAAAMIALADLAPYLYQRDLEVQKAKFELEARILMPVGPDFDCERNAPTARGECRYVVHAMQTLERRITSLESSLSALKRVGLMLMGLALVLAAVHPYFKREADRP